MLASLLLPFLWESQSALSPLTHSSPQLPHETNGRSPHQAQIEAGLPRTGRVALPSRVSLPGKAVSQVPSGLLEPVLTPSQVIVLLGRITVLILRGSEGLVVQLGQLGTRECSCVEPGGRLSHLQVLTGVRREWHFEIKTNLNHGLAIGRYECVDCWF